MVAQPPLSWSAAAWCALAPLLLALRGAGLRRRLGLGALCGLFWSFGIVGVWLWPAAQRGLQIGAPAALALTLAATQIFGGLYMISFCALAEPCRRGGGALGIAALWVATEWLRGRLFGGLPWALLGYSQWSHPLVLQIADRAGVLGVSFVLALVGAALAGLLGGLAGRRAAWRDLALAAAAAAICVGYGGWRLRAPQPARMLPVGVVSSAWPRFDNQQGGALLRRLLDLQTTLGAGAALSVWPEGSLRFYLQDEPAALAALAAAARRAAAPLLFGGPRYVRGESGVADYYNSSFLISGDAAVTARDKRTLVPLAEKRLPFLPGVARGFRSGGDFGPLPLGGERIGVLICFEAIFPEQSRALVDAGATLLVNITNDILLGAGAEQMAAMAILRSVENRVPLLRVANLGPTLLVDSYGRVVAREQGFSARLLNVPLATAAPPRWRGGRYFGFLCLLVATGAAALAAQRSSRFAANARSQR